VSPDPIPNRNGDVMMGKILQIQQEILSIDRHKRQHITNEGEFKQLDSSCVYCQRRHHVSEPTVKGQNVTEEIDNRPKIRKKRETLNQIERRVDLSGKNGCVLVPRSWSGKTVRIVIVDET
jgi:putative transposon-encoded protein